MTEVKKAVVDNFAEGLPCPPNCVNDMIEVGIKKRGPPTPMVGAEGLCLR